MTNSLPTPRALFEEAQELPAAERQAFLDQACQNDPQLRDAVEALLASYESAGDFLESPATDLQPNWTENCGTDQARETCGDESVSEEMPLDFLLLSHEPGHLGRLAHYEVLEVIGHGGMGVVLKAIDENIQRVVAIKVLAPQLATSATARKRFVREARAAAAVRNEHVVSIYAVEETQGLPYLVMECIGGVTLQQRIDTVGALEPAEVLRIGMQVAAGLAAAHAQGLIHRDIKPANILLENGVERVKITDFGLARVADDASLTQSGFLAGTLQYMSPEQAEGQPISEASDLFSLGSVLYAMCTGQPPFRGTGTACVLKKVCQEVPAAISQTNPAIPAGVTALVERLLAKTPSGRYASAAEVGAALRDELAAWEQGVPSGPHQPLQKIAASRSGKGSHWRGWAIVAALLTLLMCGIGLSEVSGVTHLGASIIRVMTPDGTLVLEVADPAVSVTLDGNDVTITGAGIHELRLRPGTHKFVASKEGQPAHTELVTILKGERKVVTVTLEPKRPPLAPAVGVLPSGGREIRRFTGHTGPVWSVAITRDGERVVSASKDGTVRVWDTATGEEVSRFEGHELCVYCAAISTDGQRVLSGSGGKKVGEGPPEARKWSLCLWELETGKELKRLEGCYSGSVMLWDVDAWNKIKRIATVPHVWSVDFSPDESRFVTSSGYYVSTSVQREEGCVQLWDLANGHELHRLEGHKNGVWKAIFSPSGKKIVSSDCDRTIRIWNAETLNLEHSIKTRDVTTSLAFTANGKYLLSGNYGGEKTVGLWNVAGKVEWFVL